MTRSNNTSRPLGGFGVYAATRVIMGLAFAVAIIILVAYALPRLDHLEQTFPETLAGGEASLPMTAHQTVQSDETPPSIKEIAAGKPRASAAADTKSKTATHHDADADVESTTDAATGMAGAPEASSHGAIKSETAHDAVPASGHTGGRFKYPKVGMAFVNAAIEPLDYELNHRFWGWRPNDILNVTDNVNNFQLGVLEVTRRTAVALTERISRTGSTATLDVNLQNAMNWFMIKPDRYWFPSAESKYKAGLKEMRIYFKKLEKGSAAFYTRTDNLIPLLSAYEDLLGSCDENLVKSIEEDGRKVSFFKADNYFFYAKGVASAMLTILEAIQEDFSIMVSREGGMEVLHHAIESCREAVEIDPWIVLNSGKESIFANHRANMAAPISHARFYLGVLIKALST